jgi:hypothetical protein
MSRIFCQVVLLGWATVLCLELGFTENGLIGQAVMFLGCCVLYLAETLQGRKK